MLNSVLFAGLLLVLSSTFARPLAEQSSSDTVQVPKKAIYAGASGVVLSLGAIGLANFRRGREPTLEESRRMAHEREEGSRRGFKAGQWQSVQDHAHIYRILGNCKRSLREMEEWQGLAEEALEDECRRKMGTSFSSSDLFDRLLSGEEPSLLHNYMTPAPRVDNRMQLVVAEAQHATTHTLHRLAATVHLQKLVQAWRPLTMRTGKAAGAEAYELERVAARG
ncbi:MAG: hypothetical protein M1826_004038 [Phylliscum demangeonii]|nr:MAG: hypothetical protein M1826_004038 [Phylliscum demangeonii]